MAVSMSSSDPDDPSSFTAAPPPEGAKATPAPAKNADDGTRAESAAPASADALAAAQKEAATHREHYVRAMADLENFRRRTMREKDELRQFAASRVLEDLLPVMDTLSLGLAAARAPGADPATIVGGIEMVLAHLKTTLANHGLKEIDPAGATFDANFHEALSAQPSDDVPEGGVLSVIRTGFSLNGRLLRPASVVVSSGPANGGEAQA
jgi:molecular chaperone GrpE